jgi:serine/threonine-protein kinase
MTVGSPLYASPEQFGNARHVDARADVWGLGVTLFELISGTVPFAGDTVHEIVQSVFKSPPRVLSSLVKGVPVGLDEVIGRCLQLERDQRYATVSDFARALARFGPRGSENLAMRAERVALATSEAISSEPEDRSVDPRATTENERAGPDTPTRVLAARKLSTEMTERWLHGRYRILLQLGEGGTARVELGCVEGPGHVSKLVVLKTLKEHLAKNANYRKMFLAEARLSARLNHPNIVRVNDVLSEGDVTTIVMEYLEGKTLAEIVGRARDELPLVLGLKIISQVLSGLHHAHEFADSDGTPRPIIHRDVSPPNVFVTYTGHVKILDFGLAKVAGAQGNTRVGEMKGKLRYISPEQVRGEPDIDCRTDIYAAGVMLWEMATGSPLWNGVSDLEVLERAQSGEIRKPREVNPQVPEALERICMKALATDRRARYQTALELEADVEAVISELGPVRDKDIAAFLMKHFGQERAEQQRFVDAQLRDASTPGGSSRETPGAQTLRARQTPANAWTRRRRSRTGLLALSGASLLIAIGTVLALTSFRINRDRQPMPAAAASVNANPIHTPNLEPLAPEPARMIELRINASPAHAKLVLDGKELSRNPYRGPAPADGQSHRLRVQADGFLPEDRIIVFERDLDVVVALKTDTKVQTPPRTRRTVRSVRRKPAAPKPAASASQLDCTPPYSLDSNGIKRFKPGCL